MPIEQILSLKKIDLAIIANIFLIILSLLLIDQTNLDLTIQNWFFNFDQRAWIVDKNEPVGKFFFYDFPKILLGITIVASLVILILNQKNKLPSLKKYHRQIFIFFLGITLIPLICGNIKKFTNVYCPSQLIKYDGQYHYVKVLEPYPADFKPHKKGQCFPAGHAVTGFCLMILFFVFEKKSWQWSGLFLGIGLGWILGLYQIAKGAHFFGDTLVGMFSCFLIGMLIVRVVDVVFKKIR